MVSRWAEETIRTETNYTPEAVRSVANRAYDAQELGAAISSGPFHTMGMVILPCSMKNLSAIHLENMLKLSRLGVRVVPPMPSFCHCPKSVDDLVNYQVMRVLDQFGLEFAAGQRWGEPEQDG